MTRRWGRVFVHDYRDDQYLLSFRRASSRRRRYWYQNGWKGDQGSTSRCVGYAWAHWLEDGPITHEGPAPIVSPNVIYREAQRIDEWEGEEYEGTSVRAGAKALRARGLITEFRWAFDLKAVIDCILERGPMVVGTEWLSGMENPDRDGVIHATGESLGGHAYVLNGVNLDKGLFRLKNSWGTDWGRGGSAFIPIEDFRLLLENDGECCLAVESRNV